MSAKNKTQAETRSAKVKNLATIFQGADAKLSTSPYKLDYGIEPSADDEQRYKAITSITLSDEQRIALVQPEQTYPRERVILGVHWHPEFIPLDICLERVRNTFPNMEDSLLIPTNHNEIYTLGNYSGVEVDCYSPEFNLKVQLLLHFRADRVAEGKADVLKAMIAHTFTYRSSQLFQFIDALLNPGRESWLQQAAAKTGVDEEEVAFVQSQTLMIKKLLDRFEPLTPPMMIKNKLLRNWFDSLRDGTNSKQINKAQLFLKAVKKIVKQNFNLDYFYETEEIIEEARHNGAVVVVPHPEQFWPILLADYDIDGYEIWNPQSRQYTEWLITVIHRLNTTMKRRERPVLLTMGDDCHMGEKVKPLDQQEPAKASREIGLQPAWSDMSIQKNLNRFNTSRETVIRELRDRLG